MPVSEHALYDAVVDDPARRAECEVHERADRAAEREPADDIERQMSSDVDPRDRDQHRHGPDRPARGTGQVRRDHRDERGRDRRVPGGIAETRDARTTDHDVGQQVERATTLHHLHHMGAGVGGGTGDDHREGRPPPAEREGDDGNDDDRDQRADLHHRLERDAERVGKIVDEVEAVDLELRQLGPARHRDARAEDGDSERQPEQIAGMPLAGVQARM